MDEAQRQYESRQKGIEEGKQEGKLEVAASLLDVLPNEVIAEKTGLPLAKVRELWAQQIK